jgi:flagellar biosynthesis activator protein FlaF
MEHAIKAYGATAKQTATPRELEADLLLKAATRMQAVHDAWQGFGPALNNALLYNRRLWTLFIDSVLSDTNPLPREIRQNIANIGVFVIQQTFAVMTDPSPQKLQPLISINREIAAGLGGRG